MLIQYICDYGRQEDLLEENPKFVVLDEDDAMIPVFDSSCNPLQDSKVDGDVNRNQDDNLLMNMVFCIGERWKLEPTIRWNCCYGFPY